MVKNIVIILEDDINIPKLIKFLKVLQEHTYYIKNIHVDFFDSKEEGEEQEDGSSDPITI
jgi:hypothetical protein